MPIKGLHHSAYRCRDSEQTRAFYEDFLGLPLVKVVRIQVTESGRNTDTLHTFFRMADGSFMAFFEAPDMPFDFKPQHDYDLHIALEVDRATLASMLVKGRAHGVETRGIVDHGMFDSLYLRDPNGYVIELACRREGHDEAMDPTRNDAHGLLRAWVDAKAHAPGKD
jgi:catechol 2,3-dioxygenase-like lactoylglutathione lyase family enzyme